MKTETRLYDDGTEPDVIRRFCCDGLCNQGRECPGAPPPAEACTEIGQDNSIETLGTFVVLGFAVMAAIVSIALAIVYFT